ncbi:MAG: flagellar protein FlgN, partial [Pseudomonadales bacterium]
MAMNQGLWTELQATFEHDIPVTAELLDLLQRERKILEERKYDDFQQIISNKQHLLAQLENHANTRQHLIQQAGFANESNLLSAAEEQAPAVASALRQLDEQWRRCQKLNEINERIAKRTKLVVGHILDLMRGKTGETRLYT